MQCAPEFTTRFIGQLDESVNVFGDLVVLELKFTSRFPVWFNHFAQWFGLKQRSATKYANCVVLKSEHFLSSCSSKRLIQVEALFHSRSTTVLGRSSKPDPATCRVDAHCLADTFGQVCLRG